MRLYHLSLSLLVLASLLGLCRGSAGDANFSSLCENQLARMIAADPSLQNNSQYQCGCSYSPNTLPCNSIPISLSQCIAEAPGWAKSEVKVLTQWIGPLVGFLLPSLVFALVIPRLHRISRHKENFGGPLWFSAYWLVIAFMGVVIDVLIWIMMCLGVASLHIVGAVEESLKDYLVMISVEKELKISEKGGPSLNRQHAAYALAITLVGTFEPAPGNLIERVKGELNSPLARERLEQLYAHQTAFGVQVGAPVVFYLGSYIYAIFDAKSNLGDNDTAHAISFGIWYGVIVIAAICSCAVLGIASSHTIESIFGKPSDEEPYEFLVFENTGTYKASWLWDRVRCHRRWVQADDHHNVSPAVRKISESRWVPFCACLITIGLVSTICMLAFTISYLTPIVGFGCRSVTVFVYLISQVILVIIWFYHSEDEERMPTWAKSSWLRVPLYSFGWFCFLVAMFSSVGGTIMQLLGVYRNCICDAGLKYAFEYSGGWVELASDTQADRNGGKIWVGVGNGGVCFIGIVSVLGWGYYMRMKAKCWKLIECI